ncbi:MAG: polynucleotide adenylyltransferase PcnB [Treponema sp.]|nr:polynucleotide adenylyltransferase PcnB [Treponema sp.]
MRIRYSTGKNGKLIKKALVYTRDEHKINFDDVDTEALLIVRKLKEAGFETYIVGGAVRDLILGKKPKDFDIASEASPLKIKKVFRNSRIIGRRFRLVHVYFGQRIFEVSTFRSLRDGTSSNTFGAIDEDVLRRDFTMNSLFYDPQQQIVVDYVGGMKDIRRKLVRPVISLAEIFTDDPVRMIRAVKYSAISGFALPLRLIWKIRKQSPLLSSVSSSRLTEEILKIIHSSQAALIVDALDRYGLYRYLQPRAAAIMHDNPNFRRRYLTSLAALNQNGFKDIPGQALGALINDYLEESVDWNLGASENYKTVFTEARRFVLPMNPPRFEMEHAVKRFFVSHGINIKRSHFIEGPKPRTQETGESHTGGEPKRRRRKAHNKGKNKAIS